MSEHKQKAYAGLAGLKELAAAADNPAGLPLIVNGFRVDAAGEPTEKAEPEREMPKFLGILLLLGVLACLIVLIGFAKVDQTVSIAGFGGILLLISLVMLIQNGLSHPVMLVLPYAGLLLTGIPLLKLLERSRPDALPFPLDRNGIIRQVLYSLAGFGALLIASEILSAVIRRARCTQTVRAKCIFLNYRITHSGSGVTRRTHQLNAPVWQYEYAGKLYVTSELQYTGEGIAVGSETDLRIDPAMPLRIFRSQTVQLLVTAVIGIACIAMSLIAVHLM